MYLCELKLWNFRKYGSGAPFDLQKPNLTVPFRHGINVLIGENDAGKSTVIDAIRLLLGTHSLDWTKITHEDFFKGSDRLRIELRFDDLELCEAKHFTEWLTWKTVGTTSMPCLHVSLEVARKAERLLPSDIRAGSALDAHPLDAEARDYLRITYLKPLRDAKAELVPRRNSRLSQILQGHEAFKGKSEDHYLVNLFCEFNREVNQYFQGKDNSGADLESDRNGRLLKESIETYLKKFTDTTAAIDISVTNTNSLRTILETLGLNLADTDNPGLGTLNRMFMASELVHLRKASWSGLRLALIEELEAHLHPQAQMKVIQALQELPDQQIILTTHSPNLASKVPLENLIILNGSHAFPMGKSSNGAPHTLLEPEDLDFLQWFLDVTKSNLFFAKGVLLVEGWSEEILLPALAVCMKRAGLLKQDLCEAGVSVVNVGSTAQLRYSKIFCRADASGPQIEVPVAVITDVDQPGGNLVKSTSPHGDGKRPGKEYIPLPAQEVAEGTATKHTEIKKKYDCQRVRAFIAPHWTLEYSMLKSPSLLKHFQDATMKAHPRISVADFENEVAAKLLKTSFSKVEVAKNLAQALVNDSKKEKPEIQLNSSDPGISYLIEAIKYVCGT